jgi:hypothetical protein
MCVNAQYDWNGNREPVKGVEPITYGLQICCRLFISVRLRPKMA